MWKFSGRRHSNSSYHLLPKRPCYLKEYVARTSSMLTQLLRSASHAPSVLSYTLLPGKLLKGQLSLRYPIVSVYCTSSPYPSVSRLSRAPSNSAASQIYLGHNTSEQHKTSWKRTVNWSSKRRSSQPLQETTCTTSLVRLVPPVSDLFNLTLSFKDELPKIVESIRQSWLTSAQAVALSTSDCPGRNTLTLTVPSV